MEVDVHGMNLFQARTAVSSAFKRATSADYRLTIIHGYRQGNVIKQMLRDEFSTHPWVIRIADSPNPGQTVFVLREY